MSKSLTRLVSAQATPEYVVPKSIETMILLSFMVPREEVEASRLKIAMGNVGISTVTEIHHSTLG